MKKNFLFSVLCLLLTTFSFNVNAQIQGFGMVATPTYCGDNYDVKIIVEDVKWDAGYMTWNQLTGQSLADLANVLGVSPYVAVNTKFHAVIIDIPYTFYNDAASVEFDIVINQIGGSDRPVLLFYSQSSTIIEGGIQPLFDNDGQATGFQLLPGIDAGGGGGISTTAVVAGYNPDGPPCMSIAARNIVGTSSLGQNCNLPNFNSGLVCGSDPADRIAQDSDNTSVVDIYPNPVQDNLFVETNGLDIEHINMLTLNGQSINSLVSIRRGTDRIQINTSQLQPGIYLMKLETATDAIIQKIIVR